MYIKGSKNITVDTTCSLCKQWLGYINFGVVDGLMEGKSYGTNGIVSAADRVVFDDIQNRSFNHER